MGGRRAGLLAELVAVPVGDHRHVRVLRPAVPEQTLEIGLPGGGGEQVRAAHHAGDPLFGVVDRGGEMIGDDAVRAMDDEVADLATQVLAAGALHPVPNGEDPRVHPHPDRPRPPARRHPVAAGAGIDAGGDLPAGAGAGKRVSPGAQALERGGVTVPAGALADHRSVPVEPQTIELAQDRPVGAGHAARGVEIVHAHQPSASPGARLEEAGQRGDHGTEVQGAGGGGGETPAAARAPGRFPRAGPHGHGARPDALGRRAQPICFSRISSSTLQS